MLYLFTISNLTVAKTKQMQLQMLWLVSLWEKSLGPYVSKPCSHVFEPRPHVSKPRSHVFELCFHVFELYSNVFEPYVYERHFLDSTFFEPRLHIFEPHSVGSLHFFDPDSNTSNPCLWNISLVTLVLERFLKKSSWQIYKDNASGMKLGCRTIRRKQSKPDNQNQAS